jgi:hypothetical protein
MVSLGVLQKGGRCPEYREVREAQSPAREKTQPGFTHANPRGNGVAVIKCSYGNSHLSQAELF